MLGKPGMRVRSDDSELQTTSGRMQDVLGKARDEQMSKVWLTYMTIKPAHKDDEVSLPSDPTVHKQALERSLFPCGVPHGHVTRTLQLILGREFIRGLLGPGSHSVKKLFIARRWFPNKILGGRWCGLNLVREAGKRGGVGGCTGTVARRPPALRVTSRACASAGAVVGA